MLLRLPRNLRCLTLTFLLGALFSSKIAAQQQFFTFSYPGPNNLALSASCAGTLFNHLGTPLVQPTTPGAVLTQSYFDSLINGSILNTYFGVQTMQVAWFVADNQGHTAVFSFTINFVDLLPPTFNTAGIPQNLTVNSVKQVPPPPMLTASDNCTPSGSIGIYLPPDSPPPLCESGSILRTWIATDASGNTSTFTQQIVILKDIAPPTITVFPVDSLVKCVNIQAKFQAWLTAQMANFQAVDPSGIASYSNNAPANFPIACPGSVTVTFSATDSCGHAATTTATFQTWDNVPPTTGKLPRDTVVNCAPTAQPLAILGDWIHRRADAVPTEACTPYSHLKFRMQVNGNDLDSAGVVAAFLASFANGCGFQLVGGQTIAKVRGWIPVDFFAEDLCQNLGFVGRGIFAAIDTIAPQFSGPTTVFEDCGGPQNDSLALANFCQNHGGQTATDICSNVIWGNFNWQTSLGQSGIGQPANPATWPTLPPHSCNAWVDATFHLTDDCGNANQRKIRFQLRDTEPPVFAGIVAQDTLFCPNTAVPTPSFSDNCAANPTLTTATENLTPNAPPGAISKIKITWTATDQCGNSATAQTVFTILDTIPPAFSKFPADLTFSCEQIVPPANPASEADATDSCGALANILFHETSTQTADPATCGHYNYLISRTFTALDVQGNSRVRTQKITVRDITPPVIVGFLDTLLGCQTTLLTPTPTTSDNCDPAVAGRAPVSLPDEIVGGQICPDNYSILRKWSATDVCGNTRIFTQTIFVRDTVRPVLAGVPTSANVPCGAIPLPPTVSFTDNCDAPGLAVLVETEDRLPIPACEHWTNYGIRRTWTATDACGNSRQATQFLSVQDTEPPVLTCAAAVQMPTVFGQCGANVWPPVPLGAFDECTSGKVAAVLADSAAIKFTGNGNAPADSLVLTVFAPNILPLQPATGAATLTIFLEKADAEAAGENFNIVAENGQILGQTSPTNGQCGDSQTQITLTAAQVNQWLADGSATFKLLPNGSGTAAPNAICPGGRARLRLAYSFANQYVALGLSYIVDGGALQNWPPSASQFLGSGEHLVEYLANDCAGNEATCSVKISVLDVEPPAVVAPATQTFFVGQNDCTGHALLPFPQVSDNCGFSENFNGESAVLPTVFYHDANAGWVPKDIWLEIPGVSGVAVSPAVLTIRHKGSNGDSGRFFKVYGENGGISLGQTSISTTGSCLDFHETTFSLPPDSLNKWVLDGKVRVRLSANKNAGSFTQFIEPCGTLAVDGTDGISAVQARLAYDFPKIYFEVKNASGAVVQSGNLAGAAGATVDLPLGNFTVNYSTLDASGLPGLANFALQIRDTVAPQAKCAATTIFTNPSGTATYTLIAEEINGGCTDNCTGAGGLKFQLSDTLFTCSDAGQVMPVTLTVTDASGNTSTCVASVKIETERAKPTFSPGICDGGDVQLFANPPAAPGNILYTYQWSGMGNFASTAANPTVFGATGASEGAYTVTVTGITGCTATGTVNLAVTHLPPTPALIADNPNLCQTLDTALVLRTGSFPGQSVQYEWFSGLPGAGVQLGLTAVPEFRLVAPAAGPHQFFVKIHANGCASPPSAVLEITVTPRPLASVLEANISVCAGQMVALGTSVSGQGIAYAWTGPNGFASTMQFPPVLAAASSADAGTYTLIIYENGCPSLPAKSVVEVRPTPAKPSLAGTSSICGGQPISLVCSQLSSGDYVWLSPKFDTTVTQTNVLNLAISTVADSGIWRVRVVQLGCESPLSEPFLLTIQPKPNLGAVSNSPVCEGGILNLSASSDVSGVSFHWSGPNNFVSFDQSPSWPVVGGNYQVIASTSIGCADTVVVAVAVSVAPKIAQMKFSTAWVGGVQGCVSGTDSLVLSAVLVTDLPGFKFHWSGPGGFASSDARPVRFNANSTMSGAYRLRVENAEGCFSSEKEMQIDLRERPVTPLLEATPTQLCAGDNFEIRVMNANQYVGNQALYNWTLPDGTAQTTVGVLQKTGANAANQSGNYGVVVAVDGCPSLPAAPVLVTVSPKPTAPFIWGNTPLCAGETLELQTDLHPNNQYQWSGPAGFTSSASNPTVPNVQAINSGVYKLIVLENGCASEASETLLVVVKAVPAPPFPENSGPICLDVPGASLTLSAPGMPSSPSVKYEWFLAATGKSLGTANSANALTLNDLSQFSEGQVSFVVKKTDNGCTSVASQPTVVTFNEIPNSGAFAGTDFLACDQKPVQLAGLAPSIGTGLWTQAGGPTATILNPSEANATVKDFKAGFNYWFAWTLSNGACHDYASDTVFVRVNAFEQAVSVEKIDTCFATEIMLSAQAGFSATGRWSQNPGQGLLGVKILNADSTGATVTGMEPGNTYFFYWTLADVGCGESTDTTIVRSIGSQAFAGQDLTICDRDGCAELHAAALNTYEKGIWTADSSGIFFTDASLPKTTVCGLVEGPNLLFWTTNDGRCGDKSRDTLTLILEMFPQLKNDTITVPYGHEVNFDIFFNDLIPSQFDYSIDPKPAHGELEEIEPGKYRYRADIDFSGEDWMTYRVWNQRCDSAYALATVILQVGRPGECVVPTIFTPNEDLVNDVFFIPCLNQDQEQDNAVTIFNVHGDEVFHAEPYHNDWDGTYDGQPLPEGTYFFVVKLNGGGGVRRGFVLIQR